MELLATGAFLALRVCRRVSKMERMQDAALPLSSTSVRGMLSRPATRCPLPGTQKPFCDQREAGASRQGEVKAQNAELAAPACAGARGSVLWSPRHEARTGTGLFPPLLQGESWSAFIPGQTGEMETSFVSAAACLANAKVPRIHPSIPLLANKRAGLRR